MKKYRRIHLQQAPCAQAHERVGQDFAQFFAVLSDGGLGHHAIAKKTLETGQFCSWRRWLGKKTELSRKIHVYRTVPHLLGAGWALIHAELAFGVPKSNLEIFYNFQGLLPVTRGLLPKKPWVWSPKT